MGNLPIRKIRQKNAKIITNVSLKPESINFIKTLNTHYPTLFAAPLPLKKSIKICIADVNPLDGSLNLKDTRVLPIPYLPGKIIIAETGHDHNSIGHINLYLHDLYLATTKCIYTIAHHYFISVQVLENGWIVLATQFSDKLIFVNIYSEHSQQLPFNASSRSIFLGSNRIAVTGVTSRLLKNRYIDGVYQIISDSNKFSLSAIENTNAFLLDDSFVFQYDNGIVNIFNIETGVLNATLGIQGLTSLLGYKNNYVYYLAEDCLVVHDLIAKKNYQLAPVLPTIDRWDHGKIYTLNFLQLDKYRSLCIGLNKVEIFCWLIERNHAEDKSYEFKKLLEEFLPKYESNYVYTAEPIYKELKRLLRSMIREIFMGDGGDLYLQDRDKNNLFRYSLLKGKTQRSENKARANFVDVEITNFRR